MNDFPDALISKVEISLSCRNLKDMDILSKSDPMGVLFQKLGNKYQEIGRTEMILNNLNPVFAKVFEIDYHFEERQLFMIELYDCDSSSPRLDDHDFLGRHEFSLGELVSRGRLEVALSDYLQPIGGKPQIVILTCQEMPSCKESIVLQVSGSKLDKKDFFGKSDPILELYRCNESIKYSKEDFTNYNNYTLVYRSQPLMKTLNPSWPAFSIKINRLCFGEKDRLIKIVCTDWNSDGSLDFIGQCYASVNSLFDSQGQYQAFELINSKLRKKKKSYKNSGTLTVNRAAIQLDHSFIDYISGGTELNFTVAIDFTASNGRQNDPRSLHYIPPNSNHFTTPNQYERAILSVGSIIQDYDTDKMFPALGFGARIPPRNDVSHCFPINFCPDNPFCQGVDGLLNAYRSANLTVTLFGPTNFAPSIRHVQQFAHNHRDGSKYFVLLIITDGIITDIDATVDAIIDCSFLPMSIIIIGVGNEDFSAMDMLDCDNGRLRHGQKVSDRDIVQFVAMREYMSGRDSTINQAALSKAVLFELPNQVTGWMRNNGIAPLPSNKKPTPFPVGGDSSVIVPTCPVTEGVSQFPSLQMGGSVRQGSLGGGVPQLPPHQMGAGGPQYPPYPMGTGSSQPPPYPMTGGVSSLPPYPPQTNRSPQYSIHN